MRYPDEIYESTIEEAENYMQISKSIKNLVRSKIELE
jgi:hypothetical protein